MQKYLAAALAAGFLIAGAPASAQDKITVFWGKGFYKAEDDALFAAVKKFEEKAKVKVDISQNSPQDMIPKTVAAMDSGTPPDVAYGDVFDFQVAGKWAFEGKLEDISDIINPLKGQFAPNTVETTFLHNDKAKKSYYLPDGTNHAHPVLIDMLGQAGFRKAHAKAGRTTGTSGAEGRGLRQKTGTRIFSIGQPMGVDSSDSFYSFLTFMDAYNVKLVDDNGKLLVDDPKVKEGLIGALKDYTDVYTRGCTPPSSTTWKDPDNNVAFHNKTTLMTHNATISIAPEERRLEERDAHARKRARKRIRQASLPVPQQAGCKIRLSRCSESRYYLRASRTKAREGIRQLPCCRTNLQPYIKVRWAVVPGDQVGTQSAFWQADRKAVYSKFSAGR